MDLGLTGKVALVLGGGGGLGGAIAQTLAQEGARVAVADRTQERAIATAATIVAAGGEARAFTCDISDLPATNDVVRRIEEQLGSIDVLINNTGGPPPTAAHGQSPATWTEHFQSMVLSVISLTDRVLPGMRERGWGRVITSTSSGVVSPIPNLGLSNSLRLSLVGWSKTLAGEVAQDGVTANVLVPGRIATARVRALNESKAQREGRTVEDVEAESLAAIPAGRYGSPQEYAAAAAFLASDWASYITGSVLRVDGNLIRSV